MSPPGMPSDSEVPSSLRTRPSLLFRLRDWKDEAGWTEFYHLYYDYVFGCARRAGLSAADAEEVAQDVFKRVAETIQQFETDPARGSFRAWLLTLARWRIADKYRARKPHEFQAPRRDGEQDDRTRTIDRLPALADAEQAWESDWQQRVLEAALARVGRRVSARHFQIFDLYTRQGWSVFRVARELELSVATIYVVSHRLTKMLKAEARLLKEQLR